MSARLQWCKCPLCTEQFENHFYLNIHMDEKHINQRKNEQNELRCTEEENNTSGDECKISDRKDDKSNPDAEGFSFHDVRAILRYFRHERD